MILIEIIKWGCIIATILLLWGTIYAMWRGWPYRAKFRLESTGAKKVLTLRDAMLKERWELIIRKFSLGTPESMRLAVIEADALVDLVLKGMEIQGEHLADRLSNLEAEDMESMSRIWRAHRMRNDLVHTPGFTLAAQDAKMALDDYEAFLKELEVL